MSAAAVAKPEPAVLPIQHPVPSIERHEISRIHRWRRRLPSLVPAILFVSVYIVVLVLFLVYRDTAIPYLHKFGNMVKDLGFWYAISTNFRGYVVTAMCICITSFPPIPGYGILNTLSGIIFGWYGFFPVFVGAFIGGISCFMLFRRFGYNYAQNLITANPKVAAIARAVEGEGFKLLFFMRLAPYPYNLMNALFGTSRVPFLHFALATFITLPKLLVDVGFGANIAELSSGLLDHPTVTNWIIFSVLGLLAAGVILWLVWIGRKAVKEMEEKEKTAEVIVEDDEEVVV